LEHRRKKGQKTIYDTCKMGGYIWSHIAFIVAPKIAFRANEKLGDNVWLIFFFETKKKSVAFFSRFVLFCFVFPGYQAKKAMKINCQRRIDVVSTKGTK